jgi:hypothetical protein
MSLLEAFRVIDPSATMAGIRDACRQLFLSSDEFAHAGDYPFESSDIGAVADAIFDYIQGPYNVNSHEIVFSACRPLEGRTIDYCEYASMFSLDMLYQNLGVDCHSLSHAKLRDHLKTFLAGIAFRYQFCVFEDRAAFPVSIILKYVEAVRVLLLREQREEDLCRVLFVTLKALSDMEPAAGIGSSRSQEEQVAKPPTEDVGPSDGK